MSLISYDVTMSPSSVTLGVDLSAKSLTVQLDKNNVGFDVQPSTGTIVAGAVAGAIVGAFAAAGVGALFGGGAGVGTVYGVAALIKDGLQSAVDGEISKPFPYKYDFGSPLGFSIDLADVGVTVNVALASVELGTYQGMLEASGSIDVS